MITDPRLSVLRACGLDATAPGVYCGSMGSGHRPITVHSPIDGVPLAVVQGGDAADMAKAVGAACEAFTSWRSVPAPRRGELVRRIGEAVRAHKQELADLLVLEVGKIPQEALGEVQEWIDICDFAVGLSRQLHGLTIASERVDHRLMEQWHPLGPVGVISAFNFPIAVWAWNAMLALVCGDTVVWKPSEKAPLCALACHALCQKVLADFSEIPTAIVSVVVGGREVGEALADAPQIPLISATGSVPMGRQVAQRVAQRLGRSLLELGGNNALILAPSADLDQALRGIVFSAVGTSGQRCTTLRRLIVHESLHATVLDRLRAIFADLRVGDPRLEGVVMGPLIDQDAGQAMQEALAAARDQGGIVYGGERAAVGAIRDGCYMRPALVDIDLRQPIVFEETFAPILYVGSYRHFTEAIALNNCVPQGLSSAVFTRDMREAEQFLAAQGSDCGIANVNIGTSGAEIGGAFGGDKWTGGGRESGSDAWRAYMRRVTNTVNYGSGLPLAQGIRFSI